MRIEDSPLTEDLDADIEDSEEEEEQPKPKGQACFIATAACGSATAREVATLREFRDRCLTPTATGAWLVESYYRISPPIPALVARHGILRHVVRYGFVRPLAWCVEQIGRTGSGTWLG